MYDQGLTLREIADQARDLALQALRIQVAIRKAPLHQRMRRADGGRGIAAEALRIEQECAGLFLAAEHERAKAGRGTWD